MQLSILHTSKTNTNNLCAFVIATTTTSTITTTR